jgi:hypothetical protein
VLPLRRTINTNTHTHTHTHCSPTDEKHLAWSSPQFKRVYTDSLQESAFRRRMNVIDSIGNRKMSCQPRHSWAASLVFAGIWQKESHKRQVKPFPFLLLNHSHTIIHLANRFIPYNIYLQGPSNFLSPRPTSRLPTQVPRKHATTLISANSTIREYNGTTARYGHYGLCLAILSFIAIARHRRRVNKSKSRLLCLSC